MQAESWYTAAMNRESIYNSDIEKKLSRQLVLYRILLSGLALVLLLGLILFARKADPIDPGPLQLYATLFVILGGWLGLFLLFHGLGPAKRALRHVRRMQEDEEAERVYEGKVRRGEKPTPIPGSIAVFRVSLADDERGGTALLWEKAAAGFPREGRVRISLRKGYIIAWKEVVCEENS